MSVASALVMAPKYQLKLKLKDVKLVDRYNSDGQESSDTNMSTNKNVYFEYFCSVGNILKVTLLN